jgi:hypothetical protein
MVKDLVIKIKKEELIAISVARIFCFDIIKIKKKKVGNTKLKILLKVILKKFRLMNFLTILY